MKIPFKDFVLTLDFMEFRPHLPTLTTQMDNGVKVAFNYKTEPQVGFKQVRKVFNESSVCRRFGKLKELQSACDYRNVDLNTVISLNNERLYLYLDGTGVRAKGVFAPPLWAE